MATTSQQQQQQQQQQQIRQQNLQFMKYSFRQWMRADAQNGTDFQPGGNTKNFLAPITEGAFAEKIIVRFTGNVNYQPASSDPVATPTAAAPYSLFKNIQITFGNTLIDVHPYIAHLIDRMRGYLRQYPGQELGYSVSNIQNLIAQDLTLNEGDNPLKFDIQIPLNTVHPLSVAGLIPIMGTGTRLQINVTPAPAIVGKDPLDNVIDTNGTVTVTGTIDVIIVYRDYKSFWTRNYLQPNLDANFVPSIQWIQTQELNPLTAGTPMYQRIENPYEFALILSVVIDGQSSGTFCSADNLQLFEIDRAQNTSSLLRKWDATTGGMQDYYQYVREQFGQDLPEGVTVFAAPTENTSDPSLLDGVNYLNVTANGFPAARLGWQVGAVGSVTTPRVETYGVILNRAGLTIAG
ncbi:hypothetical protein [Alicyclobacillus kakegawensis]|uniref:hypothetical protein n=1 Tax=Alicyclobacillus kakegawensis TaxID=392012 RepID=UPI00082C1B2C|nr:hypothetical protein [Alicyclobacillus kakegawensis]